MKFGLKKSKAIRDFALSVKADAIGDDGSFTGYGSVFGVEDSYGEIVEKGAFEASLKSLAAKDRRVPILWQHSWDKPIGVYDAIEEDATGLKVSGTLLTEQVRQASEAHALMKAGAVTGLSIGYYVIDSEKDSKRGVTLLTKLELVEISLVTFPANDDARIDAVKMKLARGMRPNLKEFERFLREAGFSKTEAAIVANRGLGHLLRSESVGDLAKSDAAIALRDTVANFSLPSL